LRTFGETVFEFLQLNDEDLPKEYEAENLRKKLAKVGFIKGNELIYNLHKALTDRHYYWFNNNKNVRVLKSG